MTSRIAPILANPHVPDNELDTEEEVFYDVSDYNQMHNTVAVSAHVSKNQVVANINAKPAPGAYARLRSDTEKPEESDVVGVFSSCKGSTIKINMESKKKKKIRDEAQKVWDLAKDFVRKNRDAGAYQIVIDVGANPDAKARDMVSISYRDSGGRLRHMSQNELQKDLIQKVSAIRQKLQPNRGGSGAPIPLQLSANNFLPESAKGFIENHYEKLVTTLEDSAKTNALQNIMASEAMIQGFVLHLRGILQRKEETFAEMDLLPHDQYTQAKSDLEELKTLYNQIRSANRYAIYWAVASWNNLTTDTTDKETLREAANQLTLNMRRDLHELEKTRQDEHYMKNTWLGKKLGLFAPMQSDEMHAFALDAGNLLLSESTETSQRLSDNEKALTKSCVEQLIVELMMNLNHENPVIPKSPILSGLSQANREIMNSLISQQGAINERSYPPISYAKAVYAEVERAQIAPNRHPETIIEMLGRRTPTLRFLELLGTA